MFQNFPPRYILHTLSNLSKKEKSGGNKINVPADLLLEIGNYITFEFDMISLAMTSLMELEEGQFKKFGSKLESCVNGNSCNTFDNIFRTIGILLLNLNL